MNMFLIIHVKHVLQALTIRMGILVSGPDTVCDNILCNDNYRVEDHKCIVCAPGTYNSSGDDASGPDTTCDTSFVLKMNMFLIIHVKHVPQELITLLGILLVVRTLFAMSDPM